MFHQLRFFILGIIVTLAFVTGGYVVFAQGNMSQLSNPLAIDIHQSVPIIADILVPLGDGKILTVTVPLTVNIDLQATIAGPQVLTTTSLAASTTPSVTVREIHTDMTDNKGGLLKTSNTVPIIHDLEWNIGKAVNTGETIQLGWDYPHDYSSESGSFIYIELDLKNVGSAPIEVRPLFSRLIDVELEDSQGRSFAMFESGVAFTEEECGYVDVANPGLITRCFISFEVPENSESLALKITSLGENSEGQVFYQELNLEPAE